MTSAQEKFQALLRELFQFDCADLDFGIYRIMNYKRDVIEKFISTDLPELIGEELNRDALADQSQTAAELAETADEIVRTLGKDALDADGNLVQFQETKIGKKYLSLQAKAAGGRGLEALETTIFNHLYTFFSRYYQDGDFISKRRYSKRQKYAIPYNGEEVYLYWANHDQYYVKTAEHFYDYTFTSRGVTVHFKLQAASVEQNNVKGDKRFFLPRVTEIDWREKENELVIPFEYRPLTEKEQVTYGTKNQQEKIIAEAYESIPRKLKKANKALAAIIAERRKDSDNQQVTFLEHHLRQYTRQNTSDFFIHKDLNGFLSRELDFYLKNEVLNLDDMEAAGEGLSEGWFQVLRVIKTVGSRIIDFLDQIESFQKMLWEKRKFVTETQYCITVGTIDESFYPEIATCDAQWDEWKELFHIDEEQSNLFSASKSKKEIRTEFLKTHPTLVIDTCHFKRSFVDVMLGSVEDLNSLLNGLLVHGDNFAALSLLSSTYNRAIDCVYSDPPYNTGNDDFLYKDTYQHSSWLAMMDSRLAAAKPMLSSKCSLFWSIDDEEAARLALLLNQYFNSNNFLAWIAYERSGSSGLGQGGRVVNTKEHILSYCMDKDQLNDLMYERPIEFDTLRRYNKRLVNAGKREAITTFKAPSTGEQVTVYKHMGYDINTISLRDFEKRQDEILAEYKKHFDRVFRLTSIQKENSFQHEILKRCGDGLYSADYLVSRGRYAGQWITTYYYNGQIFVWLKDSARLDGDTIVKLNKITDHWSHGEIPKADLANEGGVTLSRGKKPEQLLSRLIQWGSNESEIVLDFLLGSGTTTAVAAKLGRKYIGIDHESYFRHKPLKRMKRVLYGEQSGISKKCEWEGGGAFKYIHLESYEDALNNIEFDETAGQQALEFDDYLLKYMLKWETRKSETLLNVEKLTKPFSYKLTVAKGDETVEKTVDIPETFNYLLGLHVSTRRVYDDNGRRYLVYHGCIDHRRIAVIWRETEGWKKQDLERDKRFVAEQKLAEGADEVFVNGDSFIAGAKALEPVFKARMFAPVEA